MSWLFVIVKILMNSFLIGSVLQQIFVYSTPFTNPRKRAAFDDAFTVDSSLSTDVVVVIGTSSSEAPLFHENQPWEFRFDDGFPSVIYDPSGNTPFKLWYHCFIACKWRPPECNAATDSTGLLYAESDNGLSWRKPLLDISKIPGAEFDEPNNVVWSGGYGFGIFKDPVELNRSRIYKAFGRLRQSSKPPRSSGTDKVGGTMVSAEGIHWTDAKSIDLNVNWDTHATLFWDSPQNRYVLLTRGSSGKMPLVLSTSVPGSFGHFSPLEAVATPLERNEHIISAQVFYYYGIYLSFFVTTRGSCVLPRNSRCDEQKRCELAWSADLRHWKRFRPQQLQTQEMPTDFGRLPFSSLGNDEVIPLRPGSFHSYKCFPAKPIEIAGEGVRIYFVGSTEPHLGPVGTFGLSRMRPDGFAGVRSREEQIGRLVTKPIFVQGDGILVTADLDESGFIRIEVLGADSNRLKEVSLHAEVKRPLHTSIFASLTDHQLLASPALGSLIGTRVRLAFSLHRSTLYTFSFREPRPIVSSIGRDILLVWPVLSKALMLTFALAFAILVSAVVCRIVIRRMCVGVAQREGGAGTSIGRPLE